MCNEVMAQRMINPFTKVKLYSCNTYQFIQLFPRLFYYERELQKAVPLIDSFSYNMIAQRRQEKDIDQRKDLLSR